jgi:uncharacterized protein YkwD
VPAATVNGARDVVARTAGRAAAAARRKAHIAVIDGESTPSMLIQAGERHGIRSMLLALVATLGAIVIWSGAAPAAAHACATARAAATAASSAQVGSAVRCLVNARRTAHGLRALRASGDLRRAAKLHAADMVRRRYFAHVSPEGGTVAQRVKRTGYLSGARRWALGENIGWGSGATASAGAIVNAWMNSPGHRAVILDRRFGEVGLGIARGTPSGGSGATFVLDAGMAR